MAEASGFRGLSQPLWPIRYKPLPDELLSHWIVRLAHGHGLKVQTFCNLLFGNGRQVWNRDIDRLGPEWLLDGLIAGTGTSRARAFDTTLRPLHGLLFPKLKESGNLTWVLTQQMFHRTRQGNGQQFCPTCLAEDETPYFRRQWRLAVFTYCPLHRCALEDRCGSCEAPVSFFRVDIGHDTVQASTSTILCYACQTPLASRVPRPLLWDSDEAGNWLEEILSGYPHQLANRRSELAVLRHLLRLLMSRRARLTLSEFVAATLSVPVPNLPTRTQKPAFETLDQSLRHSLLTMAAWLMADLSTRLQMAAKEKALRYNHLIRDFPDLPQAFATVAKLTLVKRLPS